jgi:pimeloyl-ACP methyl ester carboxylesterase
LNKQRISVIFSVIIVVSILVIGQFVIIVSPKKTTTSYNEVFEYTTIIGKLGGAKYCLYMPDDWNGMLIIGCRGYMHIRPSTFPTGFVSFLGRYFMDALPWHLPDDWNDERFAFAWSDYGDDGYCIKNGMIRTHQLTEYLIDKYDVTGKIFLYTLSMGGAVGLTLAEKYPNLYSGVFDWFGTKNLIDTYYHKLAISEFTTLQEIIDYFEEFDPSIPYSAYSSDINEGNYWDFINGRIDQVSDIEEECGSTPDKKPKAYERRSPFYNPEVSIPIMILHGTYDRSVPYRQSVAYCEAVNAVTEPDLCQLITINGGGHGGPWIYSQFATFFDLVEWAEDLGI